MYQDININVNCTHLPPSYSCKDEILKEIGEKIFSKKKNPRNVWISCYSSSQPSHPIVGRRGKWIELSGFSIVYYNLTNFFSIQGLLWDLEVQKSSEIFQNKGSPSCSREMLCPLSGPFLLIHSLVAWSRGSQVASISDSFMGSTVTLFWHHSGGTTRAGGYLAFKMKCYTYTPSPVGSHLLPVRVALETSQNGEKRLFSSGLGHHWAGCQPWVQWPSSQGDYLL